MNFIKVDEQGQFYIDFEILEVELGEKLSNEVEYLVSLGAVFNNYKHANHDTFWLSFSLLDKEICIFVYEYSNKFEVVEHFREGGFKKLRGGVINV